MYLTSSQVEAMDRLQRQNEGEEEETTEEYEMYGDGTDLWRRYGISPKF